MTANAESIAAEPIAGEPAAVPLRPKHLLSAYAVAAFAGVVAGGTWILVLAIAWVVLSLQSEAQPRRAFGVLIVLSMLAGMLYMQLLAWLPRALALRSVIFGLVMTATAGAIAAAGDTSALGVVLGLAFVIGLSMPLAFRLAIRMLVPSYEWLLAMPLGRSILLLLLLFVAPVVRGADLLAEAVGAAPVGIGTLLLAIFALGVAYWTVARRPPSARPPWFAAYGALVTSVAMAGGSVSLLAAMA